MGLHNTLSSDLAKFIVELEPNALPDKVVEDAQWRMLDIVGVALAGSRMDYAGMITSVVASFGGRPDAATIGIGTRLPAPIAGYVNAAFAHGPDYDDTHSVAGFHPSCVAVPAALAMAEFVGATGAECLTALVAGGEIEVRIGAAVPTHYLFNQGLHPVAACGPFGAAAAGAKLLKLDVARTAHALGLAGSLCGALFQGHLDGSWVKRLYPAWAVQSGLTAALLAQQGFTGPAEVLEGKYGFYAVMARGDNDKVHLDALLENLGQHWMYSETIYKPYPCGSLTHSPMSAVAGLMRLEKISYNEVARIDCTMPPGSVAVVGEPRELRLHPLTPYHMKFSLPYSLAILAVLGHADVDDYSEATRVDARIAEFASRVHCKADASMKDDGFPAHVVLETHDHRRFESHVSDQLGSRRNPMSAEQHGAKFRANARPSLGDSQTEELLAVIESMSKASGLIDFAKLVAKPRETAA